MKYCLQDDKYYLSSENHLFYKGKIWLSEFNCNELYCYDIESQNSILICKFADEEEYKNRLFGELLPMDEKIYAIPLSAKKMYEIDILTGNVNGIEIRQPRLKRQFQYLENVKFCSGHSYNGNIYLIGASYPAIVEYNCANGELKYYDAWVDELEQLAKQHKQRAFFRKTILIGSKIYAPSCMGNFVLEFDVETKDYQFYIVGSDKCYYSSICLAGDNFWLSPRGIGPVVKWNRQTNKWSEYWSYPKRYTPCEFSYSDIVYFGNYIYCMPMNASMLIRIDEKKECIEECVLEDIEATHLNFCVGNQILYLFSQTMGKLVLFDSEGKCDVKELVMPKEQTEYHKKHSSHLYQILSSSKLRTKDEILYESYQDALKEYFLYISKTESQQERNNLEITKGKEIYRTIMRN